MKRPIVGIVLLTLLVYVLTLNKYIILGDTGEFIAASFELGIPHPPGYPLFTLIGHLFTKIPFGNIVQRVGLVSVVFGAATVGLLSLFLFKLTSSKTASYTGGLVLGFSSIFWLYSVNAEIITLNTFFLVLLLFLGFLYSETKKPTLLYALAFFFGLSLTNQYTVLSIVPALGVLLFPHIKDILALKKILVMTALFLLALSPYAYIPFAASRSPYVNWDSPSTLRGFISLVTREDFGYAAVGAYYSGSLRDILFSQLPFYFKNTFGSFGILSALLFLFGLLPFKRKRAYYALLLAFFISGPFLVGYSNFAVESPFPDVEINQRRTMQTVYVISTPFIGLFVGLGIANIGGLLKRRKNLVLQDIVPLLGIATVLFPLFLNYQVVSGAKNDIFDFYGRTILGPLPDDSILIDGADNAYIFTYLQTVEGVRRDIPIMTFSLMQRKWYVDQLKKRYPELSFPFEYAVAGVNTEPFYTENIERMEIYFAPLDDQSTASVPSSMTLLPTGLAVKLLPHEEKVDIEKYHKEQKEFWNQTSQHEALFGSYQDLPTQEILMAFARSWTNIGITYENNRKDDWAVEAYLRARKLSPAYYLSTEKLANLYLKKDETNYARVIPLYEEILKYNPHHLVSLRNLGIIYAELGRHKEARKLLGDFLKMSDNPNEKDFVKKIYDQINFYNNTNTKGALRLYYPNYSFLWNNRIVSL